MDQNQLPAPVPELSLEEKMFRLDPKKQKFLMYMKEQFGNIAGCCRSINISRATYYHWRNTDPLFKEVLDSEEYEEDMLDFAESKLKSKINDGDTIAIIFFLKTKGKKRGYVEKTVVENRLSLEKQPTWFDQNQLPPADDNYIEHEVISSTPNNKSTP
jgi:hypothetical protein